MLIVDFTVQTTQKPICSTNLMTFLLQVNHQDVLGMRIVDIANIVRLTPDQVSLLLWTCGTVAGCNPESLCCGPMPLSFSKLSAAMSTILAAMECPICFDTIPPPVSQCQNGHLLCETCRRRSERCPVCREKYSPGRSLIAEQIFTSLTDAFNLPNNEKIRERLFGGKFIRVSDLKYINIQSLAAQRSHTQKFLARLMGRSSSLENLSTLRKSLGIADEKLLSSKSQSQSELFQVNDQPIVVKCGNIRKPISAAQSFECLQKVCRHPSSSSLNLTTPTNPRESAESSQCSDDRDHSSPVDTASSPSPPPPLSLVVPKLQNLPCVLDDQCAKLMRNADLRRHLNEHHNIPIISFGVQSATIRLPPVEPIDNAFLLFMRQHHQNIWLRLHYDEEMLFCAALLESSHCSDDCILETSITANGSQKELIDRCYIPSAQNVSWNRLFEERKGIYYTKDSLSSTLGTNNLILKVKVVKMEPSSG